MRKADRRLLALLLLLWRTPPLPAQQGCTNGLHVDGFVTDPTGSVIVGAAVQASTGAAATTDAGGRFVLPCVPVSSTITVTAQGFSTATAQADGSAGGALHRNIQLAIANVESDVTVSADPSGADSSADPGSTVLNARAVEQLPEDPDDLLRELQLLAAASGGDPTRAKIMIDGFQNTSALPSRDAIASIRIHPDLFSSQYSFPPFSGGAIEIVIRPGADRFHGALFYSDSDAVLNATNPFSLSATPAGRRRFGFEFSGPIQRGKSGFFLALEKRNIDEYNVVNAVVLDSRQALAPLQLAVAAPQRLWIGTARTDWQLNASDVANISYAASANNLSNQGSGGLSLAESGYAEWLAEYDLRITNTLTLNANTLNETHLGYSWKRTEQTPLSSAPALQVAGYFNGGGSSSQQLNTRERDLEIDDDLMMTRGKHSAKFGAQALLAFVHNYDPNTFNGAYVFGGGSAPVLDNNNQPEAATTTISGIEQYRRALLGLAGGTPTTYQVNSGTPLVPITQVNFALFAQDDVKLSPHLTMNAGLRYQLQTQPNNLAGLGPRLGFAWSPGRKSTWVFHLRAGLFPRVLDAGFGSEVKRLNGVLQKQVTVYTPDYVDPLLPAAGSIQITTTNQFARHMPKETSFALYVNAERDLAKQWHARANFYFGEDIRLLRLRNINAPEVRSSVGLQPDPTAALLAPRPLGPNANVFQYESSGHLAGQVVSFNLEEHHFQRFGFTAGYWHQHFKSNEAWTGTSLSTPQSSYSEAGESARVEWNRAHSASFAGTATLPGKLDLATQFDARGGEPFNITTGTDNNGDGTFNDRPAYASTAGSGVYATRFGLLTTNTVNGTTPRNLGTMPYTLHLDANLSRSFKLRPRNKERSPTLTLNMRSANLLNHTNVTAVNTVLPSLAVGQPIASEAARRVEAGVRVAF